ncbi:MAG: cyclically-permuted mutarotase family protein [Carboxylicivirga sp.]|nr:cyclically-permuted mutarotase family protein [Carboxylicivirga sp.]
MFNINQRISKALLVIILLMVATVQIEAKGFTNKFSWKELKSLPAGRGEAVQKGLASPFAGSIGDWVFVAGGCNFPGEPVYEGGKKRYYRDIFAINHSQGTDAQWHLVGQLTQPLAYGVCVEVKEGLLLVGGKNNESSSKQVKLMKWDATNRSVSWEQWPDLPFTMDNMGGASMGDYIYLAGGIADGSVGNNFLRLNLNKKDKWEQLSGFPGEGRIQPILVAQNSAEEKHLFLYSGSCFPEGYDEPVIHTDGLEFNPKTKEWTSTGQISVQGEEAHSLHGGFALAVGSHHIVTVGGVNKQIFRYGWMLEHQRTKLKLTEDATQLNAVEAKLHHYFTQEPLWYNFNNQVRVFNTITQSWSKGDDYPYPAPAGAAMVKIKDGWLVINGEVKPGVRSAKVYKGSVGTEPIFGAINWTVLLLYLLGMLYLGYFFMKKENSTEDFFKGGGRIPWWAAGMSIFATMLSAITFMAIPAKTFATDWKYIPLAITILIMAFPVVKYYLPFFRRLNVTTAYEYLEKRFNYATRLLASTLFIVFMVARMALVLFLPSLALTVVTGIDIYICIVLMGVITIIYCTMGGVEAVVWGDVIQGFVLMGGAVLAAIFLIAGLDGGWNQLMEISIENSKFTFYEGALDFSKPTIWVVTLGGIANNLISYSSDQTVIQRYLTTKDEKSAGKSIVMNGFLSIAVSFLFYFIGTALFAYYKQMPGEMNFTMQNQDSIFPHFIMTKMPIGLAGLLIAAIFAATMSTVSSNINSLSTAFTADLYQHFFKGRSDRINLRVARWSGVILGGLGIALALLMATWNILSLFDYFNYILGLLASGLGGLFLMGIFFTRIKARAALTGFITATILLIFIKQYTDIHFLMFGFIGMLTSVLIAWLMSFILPERAVDLKGLTIKDLN